MSYKIKPKHAGAKALSKYGQLGTVPRSLGGSEIKWRVRALSTDFPSVGTGNVYRNLAVLGAGTEYYQRVGRRVVIKYVDIYGALIGGQSNSVADDPYNCIKMALVLAVPNFAPTTDWAVTTPIGPQQVPGVIAVIWTESLVVCSNAKDSTGYIAYGKQVARRIPVNATFEFTSSSDVAASNVGLFLVMCSDSVSVTNPGFNSGYSLIAYEDV